MDYLDRVPDEEPEPVQNATERVLSNEPAARDRCCHDPEICVYAVCAKCPYCQGFNTVRTQILEDDMSEFVCIDCKKFFTASNPE